MPKRSAAGTVLVEEDVEIEQEETLNMEELMERVAFRAADRAAEHAATMAVEHVMDHMMSEVLQRVDEHIDDKLQAMANSMMRQMDARLAEQHRKLGAMSSAASVLSARSVGGGSQPQSHLQRLATSALRSTSAPKSRFGASSLITTICLLRHSPRQRR